jgi:hypothetical protein
MAQSAPPVLAAVASALKPEARPGHPLEVPNPSRLPAGRLAHDTALAQRAADEEAARLTKLARYDDRFSCEWWPLN